MNFYMAYMGVGMTSCRCELIFIVVIMAIMAGCTMIEAYEGSTVNSSTEVNGATTHIQAEATVDPDDEDAK